MHVRLPTAPSVVLYQTWIPWLAVNFSNLPPSLLVGATPQHSPANPINLSEIGKGSFCQALHARSSQENQPSAANVLHTCAKKKKTRRPSYRLVARGLCPATACWGIFRPVLFHVSVWIWQADRFPLSDVRYYCIVIHVTFSLPSWPNLVSERPCRFFWFRLGYQTRLEIYRGRKGRCHNWLLFQTQKMPAIQFCRSCCVMLSTSTQ